MKNIYKIDGENHLIRPETIQYVTVCVEEGNHLFIETTQDNLPALKQIIEDIMEAANG